MTKGNVGQWRWRVVIFFAALVKVSSASADQEPMRILLTNDDGIEEVEARLLPIADRLREFAEVFIVVADRDRSGTSNMLAINRSTALESRLEYRSEAREGRHLLEVHSVNGYPADCVVLGVYGLLKGRSVDLVLSGPNGGANLSDQWFGSGTIGAARAAAMLGLPSIAISGLDSSEADQVAALADWISSLAQSALVGDMKPLSYLTVAVPRVPPGEIRGVRVGPRARLLTGFEVNRVAHLEEDDDGPVSVWTFRALADRALAEEGDDFSLYAKKWIVVTPMTVDEHADRAPVQIPNLSERLPLWPNR